MLGLMETVTLAYLVYMVLGFTLVEPRLEKVSSRPDLLCTTWVAATILPLLPSNPWLIVLLAVGVYAGYRGARRTALFSMLAATTVYVLSLSQPWDVFR